MDKRKNDKQIHLYFTPKVWERIISKSESLGLKPTTYSKMAIVKSLNKT